MPTVAEPASSAGSIEPLTPARVLDTRDGTGVDTAGPIGPDASIDLTMTGAGGVPKTGVAGVVLNVTVTQPTAPSFVTVWPTGEQLPTASSLNMLPGQTVPNLVIAKLGTAGKVSLFNKFGSTHLIADVAGWIPEASDLTTLTPARVLDTREPIGVAAAAPVGPDGVVELAVTGVGGVPDTGVGAVVLNVTVTAPTAPSFVTVWPTGEALPTASSLNMQPNQTAPNLVIAAVTEPYDQPIVVVDPINVTDLANSADASASLTHTGTNSTSTLTAAVQASATVGNTNVYSGASSSGTVIVAFEVDRDVTLSSAVCATEGTQVRVRRTSAPAETISGGPCIDNTTLIPGTYELFVRAFANISNPGGTQTSS